MLSNSKWEGRQFTIWKIIRNELIASFDAEVANFPFLANFPQAFYEQSSWTRPSGEVKFIVKCWYFSMNNLKIYLLIIRAVVLHKRKTKLWSLLRDWSWGCGMNFTRVFSCLKSIKCYFNRENYKFLKIEKIFSDSNYNLSWIPPPILLVRMSAEIIHFSNFLEKSKSRMVFKL